MGYNTQFILKFDIEDEPVRFLCDHPKSSDYKFCPECGQSTKPITVENSITEYMENQEWMAYSIIDGQESKWYDHETDMREMSREYPKVLFTLTGFGDDRDDIWRKYFLNGQMQVSKARIVFDEFDERTLK